MVLPEGLRERVRRDAVQDLRRLGLAVDLLCLLDQGSGSSQESLRAVKASSSAPALRILS